MHPCPRTYVMYHGTTRAAAESILKNGFRKSRAGMLGSGVYLTRDVRKAIAYPKKHPQSDRAVIMVEVNVGKVIAINYQGHPRQDNWHNRKYNSVFDTAWVPARCGMVRSGMQENCVFDPKRIKILDVIYPESAPPPAPKPPAPKPPASIC